MKDSEFIELLNLYLDHEINAADAARLETEVQSNPGRRRMYQDYCRMQKACKILAQDFATTPTADGHKVVPFSSAETPRRGVTRYVIASAAAAAACVAAVFVVRERPATAEAAPAVAQTAPAPEAVADAQPAPAPAVASRAGLERRPGSALSLRDSNDSLALASNVQNDPHFAWMREVQLAPIANATATPVTFDVNPALAPSSRTENRTYTSGNKPLPADVRWTAFSFQR